jgi:hypothetical protein
MYALEKESPRKTQLVYAASAFFAYPFDKWRKKLRVLLQAIIGNSVYRTSKTKMKSRMKW